MKNESSYFPDKFEFWESIQFFHLFNDAFYTNIDRKPWNRMSNIKSGECGLKSGIWSHCTTHAYDVITSTISKKIYMLTCFHCRIHFYSISLIKSFSHSTKYFQLVWPSAKILFNAPKINVPSIPANIYLFKSTVETLEKRRKI